MNGSAAVIDITPPEAPTVALALPSDARAIRVSDYASREAANAFFLRCRDARKEIAAAYDPHIERAKAAKKAADDTRAALVAEKEAAEKPIKEAEAIVNAEILRCDEEDRKRREAEQRAAEEKARKEAEEAALIAAAEAEAAGDKEEAAAIVQEAIAAPVFVPAPPPPPKLAGSCEQVNWKHEVTDLRALVRAIVAGSVPLSAIKPDDTVIGATVRAQKKTFNWPGVRVWSETSRKPTGRR